MILSKTANKILKELKNKEKYFSNLCIENRDVNSSKLTYKEIKDKFPDTSHIVISMTVKYLLEEKFIFNHTAGKESTFDIEDAEKGDSQYVIGEKGIAYLEQKKFILFAKIVPTVISFVSLMISVANYIYK